MSTTPPKLLAGSALILWGALTGNTWLGLIAAILLEARSWIGLRWDFTREAYTKAWQFSILCGAFISILAWLNGMKVGKIHTLFVWAPLILLPLELAQRYGNATAIRLNTFSFFARKKMEHDIEQGRQVSPRRINTGYPYIAIVILATAMASRNEVYHFVSLSLLIGACLAAYMKNSGFRPWAWASAFLIMLTLSFASQWGMLKLYSYFTGERPDSSGRHTSANESRTSIGRLGRLKLSPRIFWRMKVVDGNVPKLLQTATYNQYSRARWMHDYLPDESRDKEDYLDPSSINISQDRNTWTFSENESIQLPKSNHISLLGEVDETVLANPIPLPHFSLAIGDLETEASIDCNSLGTVRMHNSDFNVVEYSVWTGEESTTEIDPVGQYDLNVPAQELEALRRVCRQLDLYNKNISTRKKIAILKHFFHTQFIYTTHLKTPKIERGKRHTAIGSFLEITRAGHCEYFATATALLLREANIPTRYSVGFSVHEKGTDDDEWILRGKHAHAWCRVWIEEKNANGTIKGQWENVDLTPPDWEAMEAGNLNTWQQRFSDWWQRFREDFLIWRTRETNKTKVYTIAAIIVTLIGLWIIWRLWQSRQRQTHAKYHRYQRRKNTPLTPLHKLEPLVAKQIGIRSENTPFCQWLTQLQQSETNHTAEINQLLPSAIRLHLIIRFDPNGASPEQHQQLSAICANLKKLLKSKPTPSTS